MARQARKISSNGYLHVIVRGIGKQILFEEPRDYDYYLYLLEKFSKDTEVSVCAYCLMQNHAHLLLHDEKGNTPLFMKKMGVSYSHYFNVRYERTGHLFQDRYLSEDVKNDAYLLSVFRYILKNPQKAGICAVEDYPWSSYKLYGKTSTFVDTSLLCGILGSFENYAEYIAEDDGTAHIEYESQKKDDNWAKDIIGRTLGAESGTVLQSYDRAKRDAAIRTLLEEGLSIRQIERLTGISRGVIQSIIW